MSWFKKRKKKFKVVFLKPGDKVLVVCKHKHRKDKHRHFE